jgi:hypothetical protein
MSAAATTTTPAVNGTAAPADAAAPAAPVAAAEPTKKRPGRKPGSKNKSKAASATPAVAGTAPKRRRTGGKKPKSVCLAPGKTCKKRVTSHGLCTTHWSTARLMIERGLTTLADLISAGVARDKHVTPSRKAFLDAVKASQASSPPVAAPVVSHVVPVTPIVTN